MENIAVYCYFDPSLFHKHNNENYIYRKSTGPEYVYPFSQPGKGGINPLVSALPSLVEECREKSKGDSGLIHTFCEEILKRVGEAGKTLNYQLLPLQLRNYSVKLMMTIKKMNRGESEIRPQYMHLYSGTKGIGIDIDVEAKTKPEDRDLAIEFRDARMNEVIKYLTSEPVDEPLKLMAIIDPICKVTIMSSHSVGPSQSVVITKNPLSKGSDLGGGFIQIGGGGNPESIVCQKIPFRSNMKAPEFIALLLNSLKSDDSEDYGRLESRLAKVVNDGEHDEHAPREFAPNYENIINALDVYSVSQDDSGRYNAPYRPIEYIGELWEQIEASRRGPDEEYNIRVIFAAKVGFVHKLKREAHAWVPELVKRPHPEYYGGKRNTKKIKKRKNTKKIKKRKNTKKIKKRKHTQKRNTQRKNAKKIKKHKNTKKINTKKRNNLNHMI